MIVAHLSQLDDKIVQGKPYIWIYDDMGQTASCAAGLLVVVTVVNRDEMNCGWCPYIWSGLLVSPVLVTARFYFQFYLLLIVRFHA